MEEVLVRRELEIAAGDFGAVAGGEDHGQRDFGLEFGGELVAGDALGHDDIGEEQIDLRVVASPEFAGLDAVDSGEDLVTLIGEEVGGGEADGVLSSTSKIVSVPRSRVSVVASSSAGSDSAAARGR